MIFQVVRGCCRHRIQTKVKLKGFPQTTCTRDMSSDNDRPDHATRTADNTRAQNVSPAKVKEMKTLSPTVKGLTLTIQAADFDFKAGQWVDFFIPGVTRFTGFSMSSAPGDLGREGTLGLAIKATDYPPTLWVHTQCRVGSEVTLRVGGDFYYDPQPSTEPHSLLLIAGGVGINPMLSMALHAADLKHAQSKGQPGKVMLLFSAGCQEEIIFKDQIDKLCADHENIECKYFVTREESQDSHGNIKAGRISYEDLESAINSLSAERDHIQAYICGPSGMIDDMESDLLDLEVPKKQIHYEKWW